MKERFWRWRETLIGVVLAVYGLIWAMDPSRLLQVLGSSLVIVGALLIFAGIQRARFRTGGGGAGVVQVDEGQVVYYGPTEGGTVAVSMMERVLLEPSEGGKSDWILEEPNQHPLRIPTNAEGAEALFDVFASLKGINTEKMLAELQSAPDQQVVIWQSRT